MMTTDMHFTIGAHAVPLRDLLRVREELIVSLDLRAVHRDDLGTLCIPPQTSSHLEHYGTLRAYGETAEGKRVVLTLHTGDLEDASPAAVSSP